MKGNIDMLTETFTKEIGYVDISKDMANCSIAITLDI